MTDVKGMTMEAAFAALRAAGHKLDMTVRDHWVCEVRDAGKLVFSGPGQGVWDWLRKEKLIV